MVLMGPNETHGHLPTSVGFGGTLNDNSRAFPHTEDPDSAGQF